MKKLILPLYAVLSLGFAGAALAAKDRPSHLELVCHNGSTYNKISTSEESLAYLIAISNKGRAVDKHVDNHGDCNENVIDNGPGVVCELVNEVAVCKDVTTCLCDTTPE
jgi:hypothetical protein